MHDGAFLIFQEQLIRQRITRLPEKIATVEFQPWMNESLRASLRNPLMPPQACPCLYSTDISLPLNTSGCNLNCSTLYVPRICLLHFPIALLRGIGHKIHEKKTELN